MQGRNISPVAQRMKRPSSGLPVSPPMAQESGSTLEPGPQSRFHRPQDMSNLHPVPSGILGRVTLIESARPQ
jgi:hypothetical protein